MRPGHHAHKREKQETVAAPTTATNGNNRNYNSNSKHSNSKQRSNGSAPGMNMSARDFAFGVKSTEWTARPIAVTNSWDVRSVRLRLQSKHR